ncbi:U4/U6 small nuclear ribonucleoprotein PRP4 [Aspergillus homomorphus CBS 101889]|uniref:non-specific serine/threonine protein kinase n=1 Tax=Aspergillus homomorphus (strain CBS 101889) TaxID=1450537 RepID=A0A395IDE7_ASPHC|nr:U4/U6 small nuclear ribonucleo protein PRP4 [Aspergillus homomorphus CBS 101889]RAL17158.1 U4/U6 small nuclear ribonucleo protein PRP4 [Aspergillus homomorphus CBS 101889]
MQSLRWTSELKDFPASGFELIETTTKIEEETLPGYTPETFYPVQQGEIMNDQYQVNSKIGYGATSTVWLARDLIESKYVTIKVYARNKGKEHEINVYNHMQTIETDHPGKQHVRKLLNHFVIQGPNGRHVCLVYEPLGMSLYELECISKNLGVVEPIPRLEDAKPVIRRLLSALDYLHQVPGLIHADLHMRNLLMPGPSSDRISEYEKRVIDYPLARKVLDDRTIYSTRMFPTGRGLPVLCDLGEAQFGNKENNGRIMIDQHRAPEVILWCENWDYKVDIWGVAMLAWDLASTRRLIQDHEIEGIWNDGGHIAELNALLGPPPLEFVKQYHMSWIFWDESGTWTNRVPIPDRTLEQAAADVEGEDVEDILRWLRRALQWNPRDRATPMELLFDPWLMKGMKLKRGCQAPKEYPHLIGVVEVVD